MTNKVATEMVENIRVRTDGQHLVVAIPRDTETAQRWGASNQATGAANPGTKAAPGADGELGKAEQTTDEQTAAGEKDTESEDTPLELDEEVSLDERNEAWESAAPEAGSAAPGEGPSAGALGVSLMLIGFVAVVLWRRARPRKPGAVGGPMIKTISTHMLGPKQGLLLVDVAGEMVLLGTSDKGVQMLTRIEGQNEAELSNDHLKNMLEVGDRAIPSAAIDEARGRSLGSQFGRVLERFKNVSDSRTQASPDLLDYAEDGNYAGAST